jgi:hypothetical protein
MLFIVQSLSLYSIYSLPFDSAGVQRYLGNGSIILGVARQYNLKYLVRCESAFEELFKYSISFLPCFIESVEKSP